MVHEYFPIKTETSCQLKWTWSTIRLHEGNTSSCHRVDSDLLDTDTFDNFHNTPKKINDRQLMLNGKWPTGGCEYCKNIEDAGGISDRLFQFTIPMQTPVELETDLTATRVTPKIVEVYFDNVCNLSCLYCWDGLSSKIQHENNKFGPFLRDGVVIKNRSSNIKTLPELTEKFWQWFEQNGKKLSRFHFLGGEPFYQHQLDVALSVIERNPMPNLEFNIISNLMINHNDFVLKINRIKELVARQHLKRFDLTASIDCLGREQEYVRWGLNLETWKQNFEYLVGQRWITLNINQTFSCLTIKNSDKLLELVFQSRQNNRKIGHYFSTAVLTHSFLNPSIFGPNFFDSEFERMIELMPKESEQQQMSINYMQGIKQLIKTKKRNEDEIKKLYIYLTEMDRRRNTDWQNYFPWLKEEFKHVV